MDPAFADAVTQTRKYRYIGAQATNLEGELLILTYLCLVRNGLKLRVQLKHVSLVEGNHFADPLQEAYF
jgi:hypothetical protein